MQKEESPAAGRSSLEGRGDTRAGLLWALASRGPSPAAVPWPGAGSQRRLHPGAEPFSLFSVLPSQCLRSWALTGYLRKRKGVTLFLHSNCLRPPHSDSRFPGHRGYHREVYVDPRRAGSGGLRFRRFISAPGGSTALLSADCRVQPGSPAACLQEAGSHLAKRRCPSAFPLAPGPLAVGVHHPPGITVTWRPGQAETPHGARTLGALIPSPLELKPEPHCLHPGMSGQCRPTAFFPTYTLASGSRPLGSLKKEKLGPRAKLATPSTLRRSRPLQDWSVCPPPPPPAPNSFPHQSRRADHVAQRPAPLQGRGAAAAPRSWMKETNAFCPVYLSSAPA